MTESEAKPRKPRNWLPWLALLAVAYVVSPIDLIPDVVPGIGWADDALVTIAALITGAVQRKKAGLSAKGTTVEVTA